MSKEERKALSKQWKTDGLQKLMESMPISPDQLHRLLNFLEGKAKQCDHRTTMTEDFLAQEGLDKNAVLTWLGEHGGYCDCEVFNLDDLDAELQHPAQTAYFTPIAKAKNQPRDLRSSTGWDLIRKLPKPWRVGNLYSVDESIVLQLGKKDGCTVTIVESPLPPGNQTVVSLPERGSFPVRRGNVALPENFSLVMVDSPQWTPVYGWIVPDHGKWHLEICTESTRAAGDMPQIGALICGLVSGTS